MQFRIKRLISERKNSFWQSVCEKPVSFSKWIFNNNSLQQTRRDVCSYCIILLSNCYFCWFWEVRKHEYSEGKSSSRLCLALR
jgi:hypothetical protein